MTRIDLKPLTAALLPAAVDLDQRCFGGLWTLDGYQRELDSPNSDLLVLQPLPQDNDAQLMGLGCLWAILEEAHITVLAIHPNYQRLGLGQAMLYGLLIHAQRRGLEWATLEVRASNQAALSLYQKFGFTEVGRRRRYYADTGEDGLILWCRGLQRPEFSAQMRGWRQQVGDRLQHNGLHLLAWEPDQQPGA